MATRRQRQYWLRGSDRDTRKVYLWEDEWHDWNQAGFKTKTRGARNWINWALRRWKIPARVPVIQRTKDAKQSWTIYDGDNHRIELAPKHNNVAVALHEAAHVIDDYYNDPEAPSHNSRWLGIYIDLLVASELWPKEAIVASAKAAGLKWTKVRVTKKKARKR